MLSSSLLFLLLHVTRAVSGHKPKSSQYDYVIVGGGTGGSVLAARLSEDPSVTVALIEAGGSVQDIPLVRKIYGNCLACSTPLDWNYTLAPQQQLNNSIIPYHAGKCLGGSSAINGMVYLRPHKAEFDTWQAVGNDRWSWTNLLPYYKKSEKFQVPPVSQQADGATYVPQAHGFTGPVDIGFSPNLNTPTFAKYVNETWQSFGFDWNVDPNTGSNIGFFYHPSEFNLELGGVREDAARAYYWPVANRSNLHTFTDTSALKILLNDKSKHDDQLDAAGVQISSAGQNLTIYASREVILSAGTFRTPGLLEVSGIGNPRILSNLSIPVKINLPGVGAHYQDQMGTNFFYNSTNPVDYNIYGTDTPTYALVTAADLFGNKTSSIEAKVRSNIPRYAQTLAAASNGALTAAAEERLLKIRADLLFKEKAPIGEIIFNPVFAAFWPTLPFSSGDIHVSASGPEHPIINPNLHIIDFDFDVQVALSRFVRKLYSTAPLSTTIIEELSPGLAVVSANATDTEWKAFFDVSNSVVWHGTSSAAMMSKELGGVLNDELVVYGTRNLRVVDASAFPFEVNGHPTSTIYALAEKAADLIKAKWSHK